jgi:low affinity Fe/Cu permease
MEIVITQQVIFMVGAFIGALCGRLVTFGLLAFAFLITLVLQ